MPVEIHPSISYITVPYILIFTFYFVFFFKKKRLMDTVAHVQSLFAGVAAGLNGEALGGAVPARPGRGRLALAHVLLADRRAVPVELGCAAEHHGALGPLPLWGGADGPDTEARVPRAPQARCPRGKVCAECHGGVFLRVVFRDGRRTHAKAALVLAERALVGGENGRGRIQRSGATADGHYVLLRGLRGAVPARPRFGVSRDQAQRLLGDGHPPRDDHRAYLFVFHHWHDPHWPCHHGTARLCRPFLHVAKCCKYVSEAGVPRGTAAEVGPLTPKLAVAIKDATVLTPWPTSGLPGLPFPSQ